MECLDILERYELARIDNLKVIQNMVDLARRFPGKKAIFSKNTRKVVEKAVQAMGLEFDMIVSINDVEKPKPDPEGLENIIKALNVKRERIIYIGDSETDRIAGEKAGVKTVLVSEL
jgi:pyrophosphatase PpaX